MINTSSLSLSAGSKRVLSRASIDLRPGEMVGLIGPNGAGKTTLLKLMAGLTKADSGEVVFDEKPISKLPPKQRAKLVSYLEQSATVHWPMPVRKLVELGRIPHMSGGQKLSKADHAAVDKALLMTEMDGFVDQPFNSLSGGEKLRGLLARVLATEAQFILADEPVASLDPYHQLHVMEIMRQHADNGGAVLVVMHDLNLAGRFCDRLVLMKKGNIIARNNPRKILESTKLGDAFEIDTQYIDADSDAPWLIVNSRRTHLPASAPEEPSSLEKQDKATEAETPSAPIPEPKLETKPETKPKLKPGSATSAQESKEQSQPKTEKPLIDDFSLYDDTHGTEYNDEIIGEVVVKPQPTSQQAKSSHQEKSQEPAEEEPKPEAQAPAKAPIKKAAAKKPARPKRKAATKNSPQKNQVPKPNGNPEITDDFPASGDGAFFDELLGPARVSSQKPIAKHTVSGKQRANQKTTPLKKPTPPAEDQ